MQRINKQDENCLNLVRTILNSYSLISQVNLVGGNDKQTNNKKLSVGAKIFVLFENVAILICFIRLSFSLYYSYQYDFALYNFKSLIGINQSQFLSGDFRTISNSSSPAEQLAYGRLVGAKISVKRVGSPYLQLGFLNEFGFLSILICGVLFKILMPLYFYCWRPFKSDSILTLLSPEAGRKLTGKLIISELNKIAHSCRTRLGRKRRHSIKDNVHYLLFHHLIHMVVAGELEPFNRRPAWLVRMCKLYLMVTFCLSLSMGLFMATLMFGIINLKELKQYAIESDPLDLLVMSEWCFFGLFVCACATFCYSTAAFTCLDQIKTSKKIIATIKYCIEGNEKRHRSESMGHLSPEMVELEMNRWVLRAFFHYRLHVCQTKLTLHQQGFFVATQAIGAAIGTLIIYFHSRYMARELLAVNTVACIATIVMVTSTWLPFCQVQRCCWHLYRSLHSLMAHLIGVQTTRDTYSHHLVELLGKELGESDKFMDQMASKSFGLTFTFWDCLTFFFWCGLLLVVANSEQHLRRETASSSFIYLP